MCGICGIHGFNDRQLVLDMASALKHRGPDSQDTFIDQDIGMGVSRLKVIDLKTGDQPIYNENQTVYIVYNGEIYNYKELRQEMISKGHKFYTTSDTEVIVHLYEDYGLDCVNYLRGMFAFALWDKGKRRLFIARDRFGEKPLYYFYKGGEFVFASELKALLKYKNIPKKINLEAIDYYLTFLYIPSPLSIFENIYKLPAAHTLVLENGRLEIKRYWNLDIPQHGKLEVIKPEEYYIERIKALLEDSIKIRLASDVPLGVFLSGGIDSSAIVAMMRQIGYPQIKTFSIGFEKEYSSYNELQYSRLAADYFDTEHRQFIVKPDIIKLLPDIVWHLDEPFGDSSAILTYLISQQAREYVTVALSGIGGDEMFGGYPRYIGARLSLYYQKLPYFLRKGLSYIPTKDIRSRRGRFLRDGVLSEKARYINWLSIFTDEIKDNLYTGFVKKELRNKKSYIHNDYFNQIISKDYLEKIFYLDVNTYLVDDLLFMGDRMSMGHSLELRAPFCDYKLAEFSATIPYHLKIKGFKLKSLLKKSFKEVLPEKTLYKKKQGFMVPIREWLKDYLRDYTSEILSEESIEKRGYFNSFFVKQMLEEHFTGERLYTHQIWALLILELWFREFMDKDAR